MKLIDESSNAKEIDLALDEAFQLRLQENPSTGHKWIVESAGGPVCVLTSDAFQPGAALGQPGIHVWEFRGEQAGSADIALSYRRSWEQTAARAFTLHVQVSA